MEIFPTILIIVLTFSLIINYIFLSSKKTAIQTVNQMGIGYNLGNTFKCCDDFEGGNIQKDQIKIFGTILPTKKIVNKIKKYGFKTIRFQVKYTDLIFKSDKLDSEWLSRIKEVITWIINDNLYCILSIHHNFEFWKILDKNPRDKYINFWKQIAKEFIDFNDYLIFETMNENDYSYISLLNSNQAFVDAIRFSGKFNEERLLIISEMYTELELNYIYDYELPKDPANKLAISLHYYFPSEVFFEDSTLKMTYYDKVGDFYETIPISRWGSDNDYYTLIRKFDILKTNFINKGIPVIIGEAAILNKYKNDFISNREFIYALFSLSIEYNGIMSCLWDSPFIYSENMNYYNREINKWNDEIIKDNLLKISKGKSLKLSEYYYTKNFDNINVLYNFCFLDLENKNVSKVIINAKLYGKLGIDFYFSISIFDNNNDLYEIEIKKENGKKQYDGTTTFEIDISDKNVNNYLFISVWWGDEYININNVTTEYKEYYQYFNYELYKQDILNEIN